METLLEGAQEAIGIGRSLELKSQKGRKEVVSPKESEYFPGKVATFAQDHNQAAFTRNILIGTLNVSLRIVDYGPKTGKASRVRDCTRFAYAAIYLVKRHSDWGKLEGLTLTIFLTPLKKTHDGKSELLPENVNTGSCTLGNKNPHITIYRREEWFKVLLHELMHAFKCGPSHKNEDKFESLIEQKWGIPEVSLDEAYAEAWARLINCAFYAVVNPGKRCLEQRFESLVKKEIRHATSMYSKVLKQYGLTCATLKTVRRVSETPKTNAFSYYILGGSLLNNYEDLIDYCTQPWLLLNFPDESYAALATLAIDGVASICKSKRAPGPVRSMKMTSLVTIG